MNTKDKLKQIAINFNEIGIKFDEVISELPPHNRFYTIFENKLESLYLNSAKLVKWLEGLNDNELFQNRIKFKQLILNLQTELDSGTSILEAAHKYDIAPQSIYYYIKTGLLNKKLN